MVNSYLDYGHLMKLKVNLKHSKEQRSFQFKKPNLVAHDLPVQVHGGTNSSREAWL